MKALVQQLDLSIITFGLGKQIDPSVFSLLIQVVRRQYGITNATVELAASRLAMPWRNYQPLAKVLIWLAISVVDIAAAALLSPLALIPSIVRISWLFERIEQIHQLCRNCRQDFRSGEAELNLSRGVHC